MFKDITGKKFHHLLIIKLSNRRGNRNQLYWECQCDCGNIVVLSGDNIKAENVKSCGCINHLKGKHSHLAKFVGDISGNYWSVKRSQAISRGLEFSITKEYGWNLFLKQDRKCNLSALDLQFEIDNKNRKSRTASMDRINNNLGYIEGNVQWIHKHINMMKWIYIQEYFLELCSKVVNFDINNILDYPDINALGILNHRYISSVKYHAKLRKIEFDLKQEYVWEMFLNQKGICVLSGLPIRFEILPAYKNKSSQTASIDRIDVNKGYIPSNIRWVHKTINYMRGSLADDIFIKYCKLITNKNSKKVEW